MHGEGFTAMSSALLISARLKRWANELDEEVASGPKYLNY